MADTVRTWLERLARLVAGNLNAAEGRSWIEDIAPMVATRFDPRAFTFDSLESVAAQCKYLPAYGELVQLLRNWQNNNPPASSRLTHEPFAANDWAQQQRDESWRTITPEDIHAKIRDLDGHPMRVAVGRAMGAAMQRSAPHLVGLLPPEFLADQPPQSDPRPRSRDEQLAALGITPAPQPMTPAERFEATYGRKPGELTPAQLAAMRAAAKAPAA